MKMINIKNNHGVLYVVLNENTLGYFEDDNKELMGVLEGNKNGHQWINGPVWVFPWDKIRKATKKDFDAFRVSSYGFEDDEEKEHTQENGTLCACNSETKIR